MTIAGQILAQSHKYGPRHCLAERDAWVSATTVGGAMPGLGPADHPTSKNGRFTAQLLHARYASPDVDGPVPPSGGTVTFTATVTKSKAPKSRRDILT